MPSVSCVPPIVCTRGHPPYDPVAHARRLGLTIVQSHAVDGWGDYREGVIRLHPALTTVERRVTIAHEIVHHERGDDGAYCTSWHERRGELRVHECAAARLLPVCALAYAVRVVGDEGPSSRPALADVLDVDQYTLSVRLDHLTAADHAYIRSAVRRAGLWHRAL